MKKPGLFIVAALAIVTLPLFAEEQTFLRFYNNDALAAHDVVLNCGGVERTIAVAAHVSVDIDSDDCSDARFSAPDAITAVRANATQQWAVTSNESCPSVPLLLPPFGCTLGVATAAVNEIPGATYSWSVDGASITSGNGSSRIELRLGSGDAAGVAVSIHRGDCITTSVGIIKLTAPVVLHDLKAAAGQVFQPVTITWQRDGEVKSQTISGTDFEAEVPMAPDATSYTYTPFAEGSKVVFLRAESTTPVNPGTPVSAGRRRATYTKPVSASTCGSFSAKVEYAVGNCNTPAFNIAAPSGVKPGGTLSAEIVLTSNPDTAPTYKWTITNGTPSGPVDRRTIQIVAGSSGQVIVSAEVRLSPTCATTLRRNIEISASCSNPTATISTVADCKRTQVRATFTGKPPFSGVWSDGAEFTTNDNVISRDVLVAGTYTIHSFHDAICDGAVVNGLLLNPPGSVSISIHGSTCSNGTVVARFIGTPPFYGYWSDTRETFVTNDYTLNHTVVPGMPDYFLTAFHDSNCTDPNTLRVSNTLKIPEAPTASLRVEEVVSTACSTPDRGAFLAADVFGQPPIHVKWSDGLVQDLPYTPARRVIWPDGRTSGSQTYSIIEASDSTCPAVIRNGSLKVTFADTPRINHPDTDNFLCTGQTSTATIDHNPPPGIPIIWSITNGSIVSGQGTPTLVWKAGAPGSDVTLTCKFDYNNNDCMTTATALPKPHVRAVMTLPVISPANLEVALGKSVEFTVTVSHEYEALSVYADLTPDVVFLTTTDNSDGTHTLTCRYTSSTGTGVKTITVGRYNSCEGLKYSTFTITVH
jgi:hypothetical protein